MMGDDVLDGAEGNDILYGEDGDDNLAGGDGVDRLYGGNDNDSLSGGLGDDRLYGQDGNDQINGGAGDDIITGGMGDDIIIGGSGDDDLTGHGGNDVLSAGSGNDILDGSSGDDIYIFGANDGDNIITDIAGENSVVFAAGIEGNGSLVDEPSLNFDHIWLTQQGDDLMIGVVGGDTVVTVSGYYADSAVSFVDRVQTATATLFLDDPVVQDLIAEMTLLSSDAPESVPVELADRLGDIWQQSETAAPRAAEDVQTIEIANHTANAINLDGWPDIPPSGTSEINLVNEAGWPRDVDDVPEGNAQVEGWGTGYASESIWQATDGPYGLDIIALLSGQTDADNQAGGGRTNHFAVNDGSAYEFSYYFRADSSLDQGVYFGLSNTSSDTSAYVEDVSGEVGSEDSAVRNPYFFAASGNQLNALVDDGTLEDGTWYRVTGYVFEEGREPGEQGLYGGVFNTETGERVLDTTNFRWREDRQNDNVYSRFFNLGGEQGFSTEFYLPQVREVLDQTYLTGRGDELNRLADSLFVGGATVEGFANYSQYALDGEARWAEVTGPDGNPIIAVQAGQFDDVAAGGGNHSNEVVVDASRTYRYVQYFRKSDLERHDIFAGLIASGDTGDGKEWLSTGNTADNSYFLSLTSDMQQALAADPNSNFEEDEWYALVGYVLPEGSETAPNGTYGGVYRLDGDGDVGAQVDGINVPAFRWASNSTEITVSSRFFTFNDTLEHGWSTYFGAPEFSAIPEGSLDYFNQNPSDFGSQALGDPVTIDASIGVTDIDSSSLTYSLIEDGNTALGLIESINEETGVLIYRPLAGAIGSDNFTVAVTDEAGNTTVIPINIELSVPGVNLAPDSPEGGYALAIDENSAEGAVVGTLTATDPDGDGGIDFRFANSLVTYVGNRYVTYSDDGMFRLERDTGRVILNEGNLGFEGNGVGEVADIPTYDIIITDLNSGRNSQRSETTLDIAIADVNEAHSVNDVTISINHFGRALGPFIPVPDADGFAINLNDQILSDPEQSHIVWSIAAVTLDGNALSDHPWEVDSDGSLHLVGSIAADQSYVLTIEAVDPELGPSSTVSADVTLEVGADDGFEANFAFLGNYNFDFSVLGNILAPVVLDLDGDGVELISFAQSTVDFDVDGDGILDRTGWFGADDGLLVYDINNNGIVDDGSEISFQQYIEGAFSDLEGLAFFDSNANGLLDGGDDEFGNFRIWRDLNQDGITDDGELLTLEEIGVANIGLTGTLTGDLPNASDNVIYATSTYENSDGTTGTAGDTFFVFDPLFNDPGNDIPDPDIDDGTNTGGELDLDRDALTFSDRFYDRKSKRYRAQAIGGRLTIRPRRQRDNFDARAGAVSGSTILDFRGRKQVGYLSTLVIDLDGDGVETRRYKKSRARFDIDGDGSRDNVGWVGRGDGLLVIDRNGNGIVDNGAELSFLTENPAAGSALGGLFSLDSNNNGFITAADDRFDELRIWVDANDNGITDVGELSTLADHEIVSINLNARANDDSARIGRNLLLSTSTFRRSDGSVGSIGDTALAFRPAGPAPSNGASPSNVLTDSSLLSSGVSPDSLVAQIETSSAGQGLALLSGQTIGEIIRNQMRLGVDRPVGGTNEMVFADQMTSIEDAMTEFGEPTSIETMAGEGGDNMASVDPDVIDLDAARLALMVQDMSSFGAGASATSMLDRNNQIRPVDFFAA